MKAVGLCSVETHCFPWEEELVSEMGDGSQVGRCAGAGVQPRTPCASTSACSR